MKTIEFILNGKIIATWNDSIVPAINSDVCIDKIFYTAIHVLHYYDKVDIYLIIV